MQFYGNVTVIDDVNGEDLSNLIFLSEHTDSNECFYHCLDVLMNELKRLKISETSNPSLSQLLVAVHCQAVNDGPMNTREHDVNHPASYRSLYEHLSSEWGQSFLFGPDYD